MTGEELRRRAINGARGWLDWSKLHAREKGLWERAAMEVSYLEDKLEEALERARFQEGVTGVRLMRRG